MPIVIEILIFIFVCGGIGWWACSLNCDFKWRKNADELIDCIEVGGHKYKVLTEKDYEPYYKTRMGHPDAPYIKREVK